MASEAAATPATAPADSSAAAISISKPDASPASPSDAAAAPSSDAAASSTPAEKSEPSASPAGAAAAEAPAAASAVKSPKSKQKKKGDAAASSNPASPIPAAAASNEKEPAAAASSSPVASPEVSASPASPAKSPKQPKPPRNKKADAASAAPADSSAVVASPTDAAAAAPAAVKSPNSGRGKKKQAAAGEPVAAAPAATAPAAAPATAAPSASAQADGRKKQPKQAQPKTSVPAAAAGSPASASAASVSPPAATASSPKPASAGARTKPAREILPRQSVTDLGYSNQFQGWVDVTGQGVNNDYARMVGPRAGPTGIYRDSQWLSVALAGGENQYTDLGAFVLNAQRQVVRGPDWKSVKMPKRAVIQSDAAAAQPTAPAGSMKAVTSSAPAVAPAAKAPKKSAQGEKQWDPVAVLAAAGPAPVAAAAAANGKPARAPKTADATVAAGAGAGSQTTRLKTAATAKQPASASTNARPASAAVSAPAPASSPPPAPLAPIRKPIRFGATTTGAAPAAASAPAAPAPAAAPVASTVAAPAATAALASASPPAPRAAAVSKPAAVSSASSKPSAVPAPAQSSAAAAAPSASLHAPASSRDIVVLKVGSASLAADDCKLLHLSNICSLVETICLLKQKGFHVILVTSGAVAVGCQRLGLNARPKELVTKQAVAAVGQSRLMRVYDDLFSAMSQPIAQVLLTRENLGQQRHYLNALNTFRELLRMNIVPVVNENDTVAVEELKVGDNDTLSAMVASLVGAKWLFLLTDVSGLYDSDPRSNPNARLVSVVPDLSQLNVKLGSSGSIGTGGMTTKLVAAGIATEAGVHTGIIRATELANIERMMRGEAVGTHFLPLANPLKSKKRWIAHGLIPSGAIILDHGASDSILNKKSLFAVGVVGVSGKFAAGASVRLLRAAAADSAAAATATAAAEAGSPRKGRQSKGSSSSPAPTSPPAASPSPPSASSPLPTPRARVYSASECKALSELGVCMINYSSDEVLHLSGAQSSEFARILGYDAQQPELATRDNIAVGGNKQSEMTKAEAAAATATAATTTNSGSNGAAKQAKSKA